MQTLHNPREHVGLANEEVLPTGSELGMGFRNPLLELAACCGAFVTVVTGSVVRSAKLTPGTPVA